MNKLTRNSMDKYVEDAWKIHTEINVDPRIKYRFSQCLYDVLPEDTLELIDGTSKDFYYFSDDRVDEVMHILYTELVG
jgi:hypothetical protein